MRSKEVPTSELPFPLGFNAVRAEATENTVRFGGGRIDGLLLCDGVVLRTAEPTETEFTLAQVERRVESDLLELRHAVFAPARDRPFLLGEVRFFNHSHEPLRVDYTEIWDLPFAATRTAAGVAIAEQGESRFALGDASLALRTENPTPAFEHGLALCCRWALPPKEARSMQFAYVALDGEEDPGMLIGAWRGGVEEERARTIRYWEERLSEGEASLDGYRRSFTLPL